MSRNVILIWISAIFSVFAFITSVIAITKEGLSLCVREPYLWWREGLDSVRT